MLKHNTGSIGQISEHCFSMWHPPLLFFFADVDLIISWHATSCISLLCNTGETIVDMNITLNISFSEITSGFTTFSRNCRLPKRIMAQLHSNALYHSKVVKQLNMKAYTYVWCTIFACLLWKKYEWLLFAHSKIKYIFLQKSFHLRRRGIAKRELRWSGVRTRSREMGLAAIAH